ncbi:MAG: hypothetical protein PHI12_11240 [Dehalococcoidales bacterium]|nr:hypothetical protein [Dehalococcoidales bacterium]
MDLGRCRDEVERFYIEWAMDEEGLTWKEAKEEMPYDLDRVLEDYIGTFESCRQNKDCMRGAIMARALLPEIYSVVEGGIFVLKPPRHPDWNGIHAMIVTENMSKSVVVLAGTLIERISSRAIARIILHEALHKDIQERPHLYGITGAKQFGIYHFFHIIESVIGKILETAGLESPEIMNEIRTARSEIWKQVLHRDVEMFYVADPYLRPLACSQGIEYRPRF